MAKSLINTVNPSVDDNYCIKWACANGYPDIVSLLLYDGRANPLVENNYCLKWAARRGHNDVIKLLLKDTRVSNKKDIKEAAEIAKNFKRYSTADILS